MSKPKLTKEEINEFEEMELTFLKDLSLADVGEMRSSSSKMKSETTQVIKERDRYAVIIAAFVMLSVIFFFTNPTIFYSIAALSVSVFVYFVNFRKLNRTVYINTIIINALDSDIELYFQLKK